MSTPFYDLASLVVVPSGYKSGKIYAQKPLTTDGQLTFSRASTATRVNASGLIETVASNVPRLDYQGATCGPRLLLEPQRANLLLQSNTFTTTWAMFAGPAVNPNSTTSPDGSANATTLNSSGGGNDFLYQSLSGLTVSTTYTFSFYVKNLNSTGSRVWGPSQGATTIDINWSGSTLSSVSGAGSSFASVGNGWYRVVVTEPATVSTPIIRIYADKTNSSKSIYIYGTQLEQGAYATSYVPTTTSAVTRLADAASKTGISSLIGQTEGTLFLEVEFNTNNTDLINRIFSVTDGTLTSRILVCANTDETFRFIVSVAATTVVNITTSKSIFGGRHKVAFAYKANDFIAYVDGVQVGSNTAVSSVPASLTAAYVGTVEGGASSQVLEGTIGQALLFKTRLTNAQLAELTTI